MPDLDGDKGGMGMFTQHMSDQGAGPQQPAEGQPVQTEDPGDPSLSGDPPIINPTALTPTDQLLPHQEGDGAGTVKEPQGQATPKGGKPLQGLGAVELQRQIDSLKQTVIDLQQDALYGKHVRSDPTLLRMVTDSMNGGSFVPQGEGGVGLRPGINKELGLPADFTPNPEEMFVEGTDSARWYKKYRDQEFAQNMNVIFQAEEEKRIKHAVDNERQAFLNEGHTEEELVDLLNWISTPENFTLHKAFFYKTQLEGVQGQVGRVRSEPKHHVTSIGAAGGGIPPANQDSPEAATARGLMRLAGANRNPLLGGK
jgi:hypothetical protein